MDRCYTCQVVADSATTDHRRAGRRDRHHHPAHPLAADARPAPPPRAARPHRSATTQRTGTDWRPSCTFRSRGSRSSRSACSSTPSGRGDRSRPSSGSPEPADSAGEQPGHRHGLGRALRLRRAPTRPGAAAWSGAPPPLGGAHDGVGRERGLLVPAGSSRPAQPRRSAGVCSVGSSSVPEPPAVPLSAGTRRRVTGPPSP